ncbi:MAG: HDIG domain-containing protein [Bacteroidales bacterium]|jgi:putative nucleotidyltransferase with HDIG domain|nr:HDIG domain-containing protein [Bacteroidales bacterium]MEE1227119.1 HDIG domain-containing protein [Bacteroidales bacterium]
MNPIKKNKAIMISKRAFQVLVVAMIIVLAFPNKSGFKYEFALGGQWKHETLISPIDFPILKTEKEISEDKNHIINSKQLYYKIDNKIEDSVLAKINERNNFSNEEQNKIKHYLNKIYSIGVIHQQEFTQKDQLIYILENNIAKEYEQEQLISLDQAKQGLSKITKNKEIPNLLQANVIYDSQTTENILQTKLQEITHNKGLISEGEQIISKGEKITPEKNQILLSFKQAYEGNNIEKTNELTILLGRFILVCITLLAMMLFINHNRADIFPNDRKVLLILFVVLFICCIMAFIININPKYIYAVPVCIVPIVIKTFFDTKTSLYVFLVSIIIIGFAVPNSFEYVFYQLIAGIMTIVSAESSSKRSNFLLTSLILFITYALIYIANNLMQNIEITSIETDVILMFALNSILLLFAIPFISILEKLFGLISDYSIIEYTNTNSKILRELSVKAPGTFQHCIQVANISEDLILEIGGNAMLVRAGALHHDIGKLAIPIFFIENQNTGFNPHNELSYEESAQTIISHVTNGIKLAYKHSLPEPIIDFIRTHHGTSKTKYFYNRYVAENPDKPIDSTIFTYKGPRPFSRETAVVMMVDAVEAASRSLKNHSESEISKLVDNIINSQIEDEQFSNSDITFKDVDKIKDLLKKKLQSIYHVRIEYEITKK